MVLPTGNPLLVQMLLLLLIVISSFHNRSRRVGRRIVVMIVCGGTVTILVIQYLPHNQLLLLLLLMSKLSTRRSTCSSITPICRIQHVSSDLVLQDEHLLHFLRTVRFGYTEHGLFSLDVGLPRRVVDDFVLDDLGGVALEDLHLHGLVGDHQVAHRMLVILVLLLLGGLLLSLLLRLLLCLLLCLLLLQLMLLLGLLLSLLLSLLLLLLDEGLLVGLLDHDELLTLLLLLTGAGTATATSSLVLLQMLALMQHEVVLLEEGLTTLAHVRSYGTTAVRMASVVKEETVFGGESFATVATVVGLRLGLGHDDGLLVLDLLLDLLLLGLLLLLDHLNLLVGLLLLLHLLMVLNLLLLLGWTLRLDGLLNHLAGGGDYLYLVHGREQMARNGRREGAQIRHQTLVAGVQTQVKRQRFAAIEGTATLAARVLWPRRRFRRTLSRSNRRNYIARVHILHRLLTLMVLLLNLLNLNVLLLLLGGLLLGLLLSLLLGGGLLSGGLLLCSLLGRGLLLSLLLSGLLLSCLLSRLLLLLLLGIGGDHRVRGDDGGVGRVRVDSAVR